MLMKSKTSQVKLTALHHWGLNLRFQELLTSHMKEKT